MDLFDEIKDKLGVKKLTKLSGTEGGGCINKGSAYICDENKDFTIFIKECTRDNSLEMMVGEFASLKALEDTKCIRVPKPRAVVSDPSVDRKTVLIMEYLPMEPLSRTNQKELGEKLADLHTFNRQKKDEEKRKQDFIGTYKNNNEAEYVSQFGFDCVTCCGAIALDNNWQSDWVSFYARNRLAVQVDLQLESSGDRELKDLWSQLTIKLPSFFDYFDANEPIIPSLLHGDLWSGNAAQLVNNGPVVFDPACFYGHSEFDLSIAEIFGGFSSKFYDSYFSKLRKSPGFHDRLKLYQLFHYLNHWNHFGLGYKEQSLKLMRALLKK